MTSGPLRGLGRRTSWRVGRVALCLFAAACGDTTEPGPIGSILDTVDLDGLFAPATASERAAVLTDWDSRTPAATDVRTEFDGSVIIGTAELRVQIVSHVVDGNRHYGAVLSDEELAGPAPVIVYAHGGDRGTSVEELLLQFAFVGQQATEFVWVVPSYRSESIGFGSATWTSEGEPSPWDRDVDDALALLEVAFTVEPGADPENVGVLGFSRGAGVALLMGARDDRIDRVVDFFGPTDFFDSSIREVVEETLLGAPRDLPSLDDLDASVIQPWASGQMAIETARLELVRRSPVLFADRLPRVQLHHGTNDSVVDVAHAEALIAAMDALGRSAPEFQATLYAGGQHSPITLPGSIAAAAEFLLELFPPPGFAATARAGAATGG